jgi:hypothetical protein
MKPFPLFLFLLLSNALKAQNVFHWQWHSLDDTVQITGRIDTEEPTVIRLHKASTKQDFAFLYQTIDEINYKRWATYQKTVVRLSEATVLPFEKQLTQCSRMVVEMDSSLLNFPIEFLRFRHEAIAVFRPMVFRIRGFADKHGPDRLTLHKGFILRDPTADPEDACTTTFRQYPASTFRSTNRVKPVDLKFKTGVDFMLVSAHGFANPVTLRGCVFVKDVPLNPLIFLNASFKLVYVDGCQQGINWSYIKVLSQSDNTTVFLGPILSNDSGESSTKTINWFFAHVKETTDPVKALWRTRKQLKQFYKHRVREIELVNKSFIFRIYKI